MKKLLIVVDYQNDFVTGSLGFQKAIDIEENILKAIRKFKENNDDIAYTFDTHDNEYMNTLEGKAIPVPHCIKDTVGHELYGKVKNEYREKDLLFLKDTYGSKDLLKFLLDHQYESITLCGVVTNICVVSNAVIAKTAQPNTPIIILKNAVASNDDKLNEECLDVMRGLNMEVSND